MISLESIDRKVLDYDTGLNRFMGKEAMFKKFLLKFANDRSFQNLKEHIEKQDCDEAFRDAHTLKGVAANLALDEVAGLASDITELLRAKELEKAVQKMPELEEAYHTVQELLKQLQEG